MTKTKEDYAGMNAKMTYAKGSVIRSCNAMEKLCIKLEELLKRDKKDFPEKTAKKVSEGNHRQTNGEPGKRRK